MVDEVLSFFINLGLVVPVLPLMITLAAYSPVRGLWLIIVVIAITGVGRRAPGSSARRSSRCAPATTSPRRSSPATARGRIIFREIMPNMTSLIVVGFMGAATGAIGAEAGLAFLGLGDPQTVSWGTMLYQAKPRGRCCTGQWVWLIAPGLALALLITALTLINFGVDALSNPHLRED